LWGIPQRTDVADGPSVAPAEMAGLIRFKKGFGGTEVSFYPAYTDVLLPLIYRFAAGRLTL
jgi:lipid II:glycine glycyltransferase (peptidoglycan interpeptide bridge formation enzyme)